MLGLLLALWTGPADASPRGEASVVSPVQTGDDLDAWRDVDCSDAESLSTFIVEFPNSPLAELALAELQAQGHEAPEQLKKVDRTRLESSRERHDEALDRRAMTVGVAPVAVGEPLTPASTRLTRPVLELGWTSGMNVYLAGGLQRGRVQLKMRTTASSELPVEVDLGVRLSPWQRHLSPYAELIGYGRQPAVGVALGVAQPLKDDFSLNLALETPLWGRTVKPALRVGVVKVF